MPARWASSYWDSPFSARSRLRLNARISQSPSRREHGVVEFSTTEGELVLFLASLLQRSGLVQMAEFGELLEAFAETEPGEGRLLLDRATAVRSSTGHRG